MKTSGSLIRGQRHIYVLVLASPPFLFLLSLRSCPSSRINSWENPVRRNCPSPYCECIVIYQFRPRTADMAVTTIHGLLSGWVESVWAALFPQKQAIAHRPLESDDPLPLVIEDITPAWLSKVLNVTVEALQVQEVIHGSGSKVLIEVTYAPSSSSPSGERRPPLPPTHLCIKGGFNPELLAALPDLFAVYRLEAEFYHRLAPRIPQLRLLPSYWCGVDRRGDGHQGQGQGQGQGLVILADAGPRGLGYTFGDPRRAWPVARVRDGLAQLACLHAATWGGGGGGGSTGSKKKEEEEDGDASSPLPLHLLLPSVIVARAGGEEKKEPQGGPPMRAVVEGMMAPEAWAARFGDPAVRPPIPEVFWAHRDRVVRCLRALWASSGRDVNGNGGDKMTCLVHGDTQVGNTFLDAEGRPGFLDWQCVHVNSAAHDVTYFMTGALEVEDRRRHERALFGFYLDELFGAGGPRLEVEDVWDVSSVHQLSLSSSSMALFSASPWLTSLATGVSEIPNAGLCLGAGRSHDAAEGGR